MTKAVFIATAEPFSGKSLVALGLVNLLLGQARRVGYFKPLIDYDPAQQLDPHLDTVNQHYKLGLPYADTYAYTRPEALRLMEAGAQGELIDRVIHKFKQWEDAYDFTVVEGSDFDGDGVAFEFDANVSIAKNLGVPVILVVSGQGKTTAQVVSTALTLLHAFAAREVVVLQEQSDATLPLGSGKNANPAQFRAYANKFEDYIHDGAAQSYTEAQLYGSMAACQATGQTVSQCNTIRTAPANTHANPNAKVYLTDTWARPDMVFAHKVTTADTTSVDGRPIVDTSAPGGAATQATLYYQTLAVMTKDLHDSIYGEATLNGKFAGVVGVGDAFQRAFDQGVVKTGGYYDANGVYTTPQAGDLMNLWWDDYLHASKYGSYLDALMQFGTITGLNPLSLGANEIAAFDLGISSADALTLQRIAAEQLGLRTVPEPAMLSMMALGFGLIGWTRMRRQRH